LERAGHELWQTANSWTRENVTGNNFLANGATELNATTGLYDLDFRNYDPVLGRMNGVDPMAAKYSGLSPYNYSFNNPVGFNDPNGADPYTINYSATVSQYYTMYTYDDRIDFTGTAVWHDGQSWRSQEQSMFLASASGYGRSGMFDGFNAWVNSIAQASSIISGISSALNGSNGISSVNPFTGAVNMAAPESQYAGKSFPAFVGVSKEARTRLCWVLRLVLCAGSTNKPRHVEVAQTRNAYLQFE
jgi:RHS repeat-associated protein